MEKTIIFAISALIVAGVALAINLYILLTRRKARLKVLLGDRMTFSYSNETHLRFTTSITVVNEGGNVGTINKLMGTVTAQNGESAKFVWRNFIRSDSLAKPGAELKPQYTFDGWANAIAVPAKSAAVREIIFSTLEAFELKEGSYMLELFVLGEPDNRELAKVSQMFRCSRKNVEFLNRSRNGDVFDRAERSLRSETPAATQTNGIPTKEPLGSSTHILCPSCSHVNDANRAFCASCGNRLSSKSTACPQCGRERKPDEKFCGGCGSPVAFTK